MYAPPRGLNLLVTGKCNLSCSHCTIRSQSAIRRDMSADELDVVLDRLVASKVLRITVTGGEPLAREDFADVWRRAYGRPFRLSLNTNGTLLTDRNIDLLLEAVPRLESIMFSLDGADAETVDALRGEGTFDLQEESLRRLNQRGVRPGFYCAVSTLNSDRLESIIAMASRYGNWIKLNPVVHSRPGIPKELILQPTEIRMLSERVHDLGRKYDISIEGVLANLHRILKGRDKSHWPSFRCGAAKTRIAVFPDGSVAPCDHLPDLVLGNLLEEDLRSILTGARARKVRDVIETGLRDVEECRDCPYRDICIGGCPIYAFLDHCDDMRNPNACLRLLLDD